MVRGAVSVVLAAHDIKLVVRNRLLSIAYRIESFSLLLGALDDGALIAEVPFLSLIAFVDEVEESNDDDDENDAGKAKSQILIRFEPKKHLFLH